jgi:hypothetical protein
MSAAQLIPQGRHPQAEDGLCVGGPRRASGEMEVPWFSALERPLDSVQEGLRLR